MLPGGLGRGSVGMGNLFAGFQLKVYPEVLCRDWGFDLRRANLHEGALDHMAITKGRIPDI